MVLRAVIGPVSTRPPTSPNRHFGRAGVGYPRAVVLTVGFDLDMTLVDSRAGIVATLQHTLARYAVSVAEDELWPHIGHPLPATLAAYLPEALVQEATDAYRAEYLNSAVRVTTAFPGAAESLAAIRRAGGRVVVVSAKHAPAVHAVLAQVGLAADEVVGDLFGHDKASALAEHGVDVYVGDHVGDMQGAVAAGAEAVAVLTGPSDRASLEEAGATVILDSLSAFSAWLSSRPLGG